jgi:flagellar biosynthetic protein FliP
MRRVPIRAVVLLLALLLAAPAHAVPPVPPVPESITELNPLSIIEDASDNLPGFEGGLSASLNVLLLLTVLTLAPSILILCTCFTRFMIVLALLRQALGTQALPPGQVLVGLSLFMTFVVMAPTASRMYEEGIRPYADGQVDDPREAWELTKQPLREFMFLQIEQTGNWSGVYMMLNYRGIDTSDRAELKYSDVDMLSLVPAYILSELKVSFLMGFRVYLPFLVIDMVIASMLISMGMLMLPPVLISLPFKILLFVLVDGWQLIAGSLMASVATGSG